jgi:hypothetical protein
MVAMSISSLIDLNRLVLINTTTSLVTDKRLHNSGEAVLARMLTSTLSINSPQCCSTC